MIIVLFHVICLLGKFVYQKYQCKKRNEMHESEGTPANRSDMFRMVDPMASDDDEDLEKSSTIRFYPPAYIQRYTAVCDVLTDPRFKRKLRKVVDFGCAELGFVNHLKNVSGIEEILCVDVDGLLLELHKAKAEPLILEYVVCRASPLVIEICKGSVTDSDKKLEGTDAVICIELIEHLYPDALTDLPYNIFGYIKPEVAVITTPNADFNVLFPNFTGFRHYDHKFEWTRQQFQDWAENVVLRYPNYEVTFHGICYGPKGTEHLGACSQMAVFTRICDTQTNNAGVEGLYKTVALYEYPFKIDNRSDEQKIFDEAVYHIQKLACKDGEMQDQVSLNELVEVLEPFSVTVETLRTILLDGGKTIEDTENGPVVLVPEPSESEFAEDEFAVDESLMNEDIDNYWDMGTGPMRHNGEEILQQDLSVENWDNNYWEEPSIIIPQQNDETQDHTDLLDEQDNSVITEQSSEDMEDYESRLGDAEMPYYPSDNIRDISTNPALPNILNPRHADDPDRSLDHNYSVSSNADNLDVTGESSSANDQSAMQRLNRMMNFQTCPSVSRSSTSPEPYLLQSVHMDRMLRGNQSMSNDWALNNTFHNLDISREEEVVRTNDTIFEEDEILNEKFVENEDIQHPSGSNYVHLNEPQFTSSPKIDAKVASKGSKRRSLVYPTQFHNQREETLEEIDMATRRIDTITLEDDEVEADSSNSMADSDTSASIVTLDEQNSSIHESWTAPSQSSDKRRKLNLSEPNIPDIPIKCSSFDSALKNVASQRNEGQISAKTCNVEAKADDSYRSTKETALSNAFVLGSNTKSPKEFKNDEQTCDLLPNSYKRKSKGKSLSPLKINNDYSPDNSSSHGVTDSGYPNSASTQGTPSECELPSIEDDHISSDHKPSTVVETYCPKSRQDQMDNLESEDDSYTATKVGKSSQYGMD